MPGYPRALAGPRGWPVAVQDLRLVLVPRRGRPVRIQDQGPAPPVDDDLVVIEAQEDAVLGAGFTAVGLMPDVVDLARTGGLVAATQILIMYWAGNHTYGPERGHVMSA
jgi:hypothetical protein